MANVMNIVPAISQILSKRQKCQTIQRLYKDYTRLTLCKPIGNAISNVITFILPYLSTVMLWLAFKRITWPESCLYYLDFFCFTCFFFKSYVSTCIFTPIPSFPQPSVPSAPQVPDHIDNWWVVADIRVVCDALKGVFQKGLGSYFTVSGLRCRHVLIKIQIPLLIVLSG